MVFISAVIELRIIIGGLADFAHHVVTGVFKFRFGGRATNLLACGATGFQIAYRIPVVGIVLTVHQPGYQADYFLKCVPLRRASSLFGWDLCSPQRSRQILYGDSSLQTDNLTEFFERD